MNKILNSHLSGGEISKQDAVYGSQIRHSLLALIQQDFPSFSLNSVISKRELNTYREKYIRTYLVQEMDELSELEQKVIQSIADNTKISDHTDSDALPNDTYGQRVADKVATFGGSWTFIIAFGVFILIWICINILWLANQGFDPYPFILLNLILSCLASMQAPVIMMSQNRKDEKDRVQAERDYLVNLKAELEIRTLHEKVDHLMIHQYQELFEMQKIQMEMLSDLLDQKKD
jgi:uncharacterized membrane protein